MSGHSHWAGIKHKKEIEDKKRGKIFSKLARIISIAAKEGQNPVSNSKLRMSIEKAKEFNMPNENIERAIKKGAGGMGGENLEEFIYEGMGPGNIAIIVEGITDNKNRTINELKQIFSHYGGKIVPERSVRWLFEKYGVIKCIPGEKSNKEDIELSIIEMGTENLKWNGSILEIYTKPEEMEKVKKEIETAGIKINSSAPGWVPKEEISMDKNSQAALNNLFVALDENDDVQEIYSNLKRIQKEL